MNPINIISKVYWRQKKTEQYSLNGSALMCVDIHELHVVL